MTAGRAEERGIAVVEDAAVGGDEPVPAVVARLGDPDDGLVQALTGEITEEAGVPEVAPRRQSS